MADNETMAVETEEADTSTALTVTEAPVIVDEPAAAKPDKKQMRKEKKEKKRRYGEVMTTGAFFRTFLLLLIPGLNVLLIIFWAIGAAKNRNKVNLSRGLMAFFIIEVLLALIVAGAGYIVADQKEAEVINFLDDQTNGVISYLEIETYKDLPKVLTTYRYLKEKNPPAPVVDTTKNEPEPEPEIPKTCYAYNPEGIESLDQFKELFEAQYAAKEQEEAETAAAKTEDKAEEKTEPEKEPETEKEPDLTTLFGILENANVDMKNYERIYIILDTEDTNCVIVFNPAGSFEVGASFPAISAGSEYVIIGGAN